MGRRKLAPTISPGKTKGLLEVRRAAYLQPCSVRVSLSRICGSGTVSLGLLSSMGRKSVISGSRLSNVMQGSRTPGNSFLDMGDFRPYR